MTDLIIRALLEASLRVSLVAGVVALMLAALRVRSSRTRHAAWTAVLVAMLLMPILPYSVARLAITLPSLPRGGEASPAPRVASPAVPAPAPAVVDGPGPTSSFVPAQAGAAAETSSVQERQRPLWPMLA